MRGNPSQVDERFRCTFFSLSQGLKNANCFQKFVGHEPRKFSSERPTSAMMVKQEVALWNKVVESGVEVLSS